MYHTYIKVNKCYVDESLSKFVLLLSTKITLPYNEFGADFFVFSLTVFLDAEREYV